MSYFTVYDTTVCQVLELGQIPKKIAREGSKKEVTHRELWWRNCGFSSVVNDCHIQGLFKAYSEKKFMFVPYQI